jgi:Transglycosylase-like domain
MRRTVVAIVAALFVIAPSSAVASKDSQIVARWTERLELREKMHDTWSAKRNYWDARHRNAEDPAQMWKARNYESDAREMARKRKWQVDYAQRVINRHSPKPAARPSGGGAGGILAAIRQCESGGDYTANTGNGFYGAYQFTVGTWHAYGGTGMPHLASPGEQDRVAANLLDAVGVHTTASWPNCP